MSIRSGILLVLVMGASAANAATPKPERKWNHVGRTLHAQATRHQSISSRERFCSSGCRQKGAHKAMDLGACKSGCEFGA